MKKQIVSIQYLRAFGALAVVASHVDHSAVVGQSGVDLFFVISGFIMWTMSARPIAPLAFLWNRMLRVVPLYWVATLLMALHQRAPLHDVVRSMFFVPYFGAGDQIWPVLVQGWTLNYEMFFYILIGLVLPLPRRAALVLLPVSIGLLSLTYASVPADSAALLTYTNPLMLEFAAGVGLAEAWRRQRLPGAGMALLLMAVGILALWLPGWQTVPQTWRFAAWGLPMALLVTAALSLEKAGRVMRLAPIAALGDASFSIYLWHSFLMTRVTGAVAEHGLPVRMVAALVASGAVGLVSFRCFERPVTAWLRGATRTVTRGLARRMSSV